MTAFFFSALIQKEEGDRVEKTDGFSCDETAGKGIFNDGSGTDIILTGDNKAYISPSMPKRNWSLSLVPPD